MLPLTVWIMYIALLDVYTTYSLYNNSIAYMKNRSVICFKESRTILKNYYLQIRFAVLYKHVIALDGFFKLLKSFERTEIPPYRRFSCLVFYAVLSYTCLLLTWFLCPCRATEHGAHPFLSCY